jgi:hypothetical protein
MATGGKGCSCSSPYDAISKAGEERIDKVNLLPFDVSKFLDSGKFNNSSNFDNSR